MESSTNPAPLDIAEMRRLHEQSQGSDAAAYNTMIHFRSYMHGHALEIIAAIEERDRLRAALRRILVQCDSAHNNCADLRHHVASLANDGMRARVAELGRQSEGK